MFYKKIIFNVFFLMSILLVLSGCDSVGQTYGSGGAGSGYSSGGYGKEAGSDSGSLSLAKVHNPEPSSLLLLASGLAGMGIYARSKIRSKKRK